MHKMGLMLTFSCKDKIIWVTLTPSSFLTPSHSHCWIFLMQSWRNLFTDADLNIWPLTANLIEPDSPLGLPSIVHQVPSSKDTKLSRFTWVKQLQRPYVWLFKSVLVFSGDAQWSSSEDRHGTCSHWTQIETHYWEGNLKHFGDSWVLY